MDNGGAFTDRLFGKLPTGKGLRALDIGCGAGDLTLRLAARVGASGHVTAIDPDEKALARARERIQTAGFHNVTFLHQSIADVAGTSDRFDAITCRRVLMYLPDRVAALRIVRDLLTNDGVFAAQEHSPLTTPTAGELPLRRQVNQWIWQTVKAEGGHPDTGLALFALLAEAGFSSCEIFTEAKVETPQQPSNAAAIVAAMAPRMVAAKIATKGDLDIETLDARLQAERRNSTETFIPEFICGAVARL